MKAFELKQLIREEIYKTLNEVELEQDMNLN
jgi:ribosomal protein L29